MSLRPVYNQFHQTEGPLPHDIFDFELNADHPIPTQIKLSSELMPDDVLAVELDEQGRLVSLASETHGSSMTREWTGDGTYADVFSAGGSREVNPLPNNHLLVTQTDSNGASHEGTLWRGQVHGEESTTLIARKGHYGPKYTAKVSPAGKVLSEVEMSSDAVEFGLDPDYTLVWERDDEGNLIVVRTLYRDGKSGEAYYERRIARTGSNTLRVVGAYYPGGEEEIVGHQQDREYDDRGRVVTISSALFVPTMSRGRVDFELSYD